MSDFRMLIAHDFNDCFSFLSKSEANFEFLNRAKY